MGFLESILKSAVRRTVNRTVNKVVNKTVDGVLDNFDNKKKQSAKANSQPAAQQSRTCSIFKPNLAGQIVKHESSSSFGDIDINYSFELPEKLFEKDSGAVEVPVCYVVANNRDEFEQFVDELDCPLPDIHIDDSGSMIDYIKRSGKNVVVSKVENHPIIVEKYEYDTTSDYINKGKVAHNISFIFYNSPEDKAHNSESALTLSFNDSMNRYLCTYAMQAFDLIASTLRIEPRESSEE